MWVCVREWMIWIRAYALLLLGEDALQSFFEKFATTCTQRWAEVKCFVGFELFGLRSWLYTNESRSSAVSSALVWQFAAAAMTIGLCCQLDCLVFSRSLIIIVGWVMVVTVSNGGGSGVFVGAGRGGCCCCCFCSDNCHCGSGCIDKRRSTLN